MLRLGYLTKIRSESTIIPQEASTHKSLTSARRYATLSIVPDFYTFFEVVFDPARPARYWLESSGLGVHDLTCMDYLRDMIELCLGPSPSFYDVETFCEDQYKEAVMHALFLVHLTAGSPRLSWLPAASRAAIVIPVPNDLIMTSEEIEAMRGAEPKIEMDAKDTAPIGISKPESLMKAETVETRCYLCAYRGVFFVEQSPKVCTLCQFQFLTPESSC